METIEFWKMNGSGNDFILIDNRDGIIPENEMADIVKGVCRRRESVGADGVIFLMDSVDHDFAWKFFNADGGEVEMCGNGGRCVARFAFLKGITGTEMTFKTLAGPVSAVVDGRIVRILMPDPGKLEKDIDIQPLEGWLSTDFINTGVPHVVIHVSDLDDFPVKEQGKDIRFNTLFAPEGTNANFFRLSGKNRLQVRTFERGVEDETLACGTGCIACSLIASARGMIDSPVEVNTRGGETLKIYFDKDGTGFRHVWLEGNTSISYQGFLHEEAYL